MSVFCIGTRALSVLGQPLAAWIVQRDVSGTGRGQKLQQAQRLGQLARARQLLCAPQTAMTVSVVLPAAPAPNWGLVPSQELVLCWEQECC